MSSKSAGGGKVLIDAGVTATSNDGSQLKLDANAALKTPGEGLIGAPKVSIVGESKVSAKAGSGNLELGPAGAKLSGAKATVSGESAVEVAGGIVKIN